jgi:hypothetical protein
VKYDHAPFQQELGEQRVANTDLRRDVEIMREAIQPLLPRGQTIPRHEPRTGNSVVPMNTDASPIAVRSPTSPPSTR